MDFAVETTDLTKTIGLNPKIALVDKVNLKIMPGSVFGLIGPNGAGKTTTFKLLLGLSKISSGRAALFGKPVPHPSSRQNVGFLPEVVNHPDHMSGQEYLMFHAQILNLQKPQEKVDEALDKMDMLYAKHKPLGECSKGMKQRIDLARVLLGQAKLIFLDEPVSGLDPHGQKRLTDALRILKQEGLCIFINSHAVEILEHICDDIAIIDKGRIVENESLSKLLEPKEINILFKMPTGKNLPTLAPEHSYTQTPLDSEGYKWTINPDCNPALYVKALSDCGAEIYEVSKQRLTLQEVFSKAVNVNKE